MLKTKIFKFNISIILLLFILNSCRVTFVPNYDASINQQIENTSKLIDKFYLDIIETTTTDSADRKYNHFASKYVDIEVELNALYNKNKMRPLNQNSTRICEITLELWIKYKNEHKSDNYISNGIVKLNRKFFNDLFYAMQVAEKAKELINNPPK